MQGSMRTRRSPIVLAGLVALCLVLTGWDGPRREPAWPIRVTLDVPPGATGVGFSPDGRWFLTRTDGDESAGDRAWDPKTGCAAGVPVGPPLARAVVARDRGFAVGWTGPGRGAEAELVQVDAASGAIRRRFAVDPRDTTEPDSAPLVSFCGEVEPWSCRDIRPALIDGDRSVQILCRDGRGVLEVRTWDLATGVEARRPIVEPAGRGIADLAGPVVESPDGRLVGYRGRGWADLQLWDLGTGRPHGPRLPVHPLVDFSADGRLLFAVARGAAAGTIDVYDVGDCRRLRGLAVVSPGFHRGSLAVAPDGRTVAAFNWRDRDPSPTSALADFARAYVPGWPERIFFEVVVVDLATGARLARAANSSNPIYGPDGRTIITWEPGGRHVVREVPRPPPGQPGEDR